MSSTIGNTAGSEVRTQIDKTVKRVIDSEQRIRDLQSERVKAMSDGFSQERDAQIAAEIKGLEAEGRKGRRQLAELTIIDYFNRQRTVKMYDASQQYLNQKIAG